MFTGIIETIGTIVSVSYERENMELWVSSPISNALSIDQSVSHNGVCLTVVELRDLEHRVIAIRETLSKTAMSEWNEATKLNLERCMLASGRFDGHIVQGHVDQKGECMSIIEQNGSWVYEFRYQPSLQNVVVEKGSVCINGISLTAYDAVGDTFRVAIIPYTYEHTTMPLIQVGSWVNLEFDIIGKYVARMMRLK